MKKYTVYMHEHRKNGKKYIGITSQIPKKRWRNGYGYMNNAYFFRAIRKDGWDMFNHYILFTDLSKRQAEKIEIKLIKKYNSSNYRYGYNIDLGGHLASETTRKKISEAKKGKPMSEETKKRIAETNMKKYGHRSSFTDEIKLKIGKKLGREVVCIETNIIYYSTMEAERKTKIANGNISAVCNGKHKTAGGYHWEWVSNL